MLQKIDPYYYSECSDVVKDYIKELEIIIEDYLTPQTIEGPVAKTITFNISHSDWDKLSLDSLVGGAYPVTIHYALEALIKMPLLFTGRTPKYNYSKMAFMLYIYTLDTFRVSDVREFFSTAGINIKHAHPFIEALIETGEVSFNVVSKAKTKKSRQYFITQKGKTTVAEFIHDVLSKPIKINFYDKNLKWNICEAKGFRGTKQNLYKRHRDVFGIKVQSRSPGKKSRLSYRRHTRPRE